MIRLIFLFIVSASFYSTNFETRNNFIEKNYKGGEQVFLKYIYENISYPEDARNRCTMGFVKIKLELQKSGEITAIRFHNEIGDGIEKEIVRILSLTSGNWKSSKEERSTDLLFDWRINENLSGKGDINVSAGIQGICESTKNLESKLKRYIKKEKYKKAKGVLDKLKSRDSFTDAYDEVEKILDKVSSKK